LRQPDAAFSLIELVVVIVVIALALPPLAMLLHETVSRSEHSNLQVMATGLARGLMEEVLSKDFEDPQAGAGSFGAEEGSRSQYDDVDDYDGLNNKPPRDAEGDSLGHYSGFRARVTVRNVDGDDPGGPARPDGSTAFKRVTVRVSWQNDEHVVRLVGLRGNPGSDESEGGASGITFLERIDHTGGPRFRVRNDTGEDLYVTHITLSWTDSPAEAYYPEVKLRVEGYTNYYTVWSSSRHNDRLMGNGGTAMFNMGDRALVPAGAVMRFKIDDFYETPGGSGWVDMRHVTFSVELQAGAELFTPFTVPAQM
jgi:MSHA pilin protein MshD